MKVLKLPHRLSVIADKIPNCDTVADVGCDHAKLAIWLVRNNRVKSVIATDIRMGPLSRACANVERTGLSDRIELRLCDGLDGVSPVSAVIIAGMGGETIAGILKRTEWTRNPGLLLYLQPMTAADELRLFLACNGYMILDESYAREGEKIYVILTVTQGSMLIDEPSKLYLSDAAKNDPLVSEYVGGVIKMLSKKLEGLKSAKIKDENEIVSIKAIIETLNKRRDSYAKGI